LQAENAIQAAFVLNQALAQNSDYTEARLLLSEINLRDGKAIAIWKMNAVGFPSAFML
jgi:hypothetical protein